jgi:WD repeat-containing protein 1 (actin-interacting protein 1)
MIANSNSCIPPTAPVTAQVPSLPNTIRGEPCPLDGEGGRLNAGKAILAYPSGKLCVFRSLKDGEKLPNSQHPILVYRGHQYATSSCKMSTSGAYVASGDTRGKLRVWALDHEEHLCKLDTQGLSSAIRDIAWDGESKRIAYAGERLDNSSMCTNAIQWDTGVTQGQLYQHMKGKSCAIAFKPNRPFRIVTGGREDGKLHFHKGPPFQKIPLDGDKPCETAHSKPGVNCVRYTSNGELVASVGNDKGLYIYDGTDLALKTKLDGVHTGTIYACAWGGDNQSIITASADGTCKLFEVAPGGSSVKEKCTWKVAEHMLGKVVDKPPRGGMQLGCAFVGGNIPVSVSTNNQIAILPMPGDSKDIEILTGHDAPIGAITFDHANGVFYTGDSDGILCKWDLQSIKALQRICPVDNKDLEYKIHSGAVSGLTVLNDSQLLSVGWDDLGYYTKNGELQSGKLDIGAQPTSISTGKSITAVATVKGLLILKDGKASGGIIPLKCDANCVVVAKDDSAIYVGGNNNKIYAYTTSGSEIKVVEDGHLKPVTALAVSDDGKMLAAGDTRDVCVYSLPDMTPIIGKSRWCFHLQKVTALAFSPDGKVVASGGSDDSIYLWSLEKESKRIHYQFAHRGGVVGLGFKKDAPYTFVSAGADSCVVQWDAAADVKSKFV